RARSLGCRASGRHSDRAAQTTSQDRETARSSRTTRLAGVRGGGRWATIERVRKGPGQSSAQKALRETGGLLESAWQRGHLAMQNGRIPAIPEVRPRQVYTSRESLSEDQRVKFSDL